MMLNVVTTPSGPAPGSVVQSRSKRHRIWLLHGSFTPFRIIARVSTGTLAVVSAFQTPRSARLHFRCASALVPDAGHGTAQRMDTIAVRCPREGMPVVASTVKVVGAGVEKPFSKSAPVGVIDTTWPLTVRLVLWACTAVVALKDPTRT